MVKVTFIDSLAQSSKAGKPYWKVKTADGKEGSVFFQPTLHTPVDVDEKYSEQFHNYSWFLPKAGGFAGSGSGFKKPYVPNVKDAKSRTLVAAALVCEKVHGTVTGDQTLALAKKFYDQFVNKEDEPAQQPPAAV